MNFQMKIRHSFKRLLKTTETNSKLNFFTINFGTQHLAVHNISFTIHCILFTELVVQFLKILVLY